MSSWAALAATPPTTTENAAAALPKAAAAVVEKVTSPSICIPRLPATFSDGQLVDIINEIGLGKIEKIDLILKEDKNGVDYLMAFVHMEEWLSTETAQSVREDLLNNEKITVVYEDPLYLTLTKSYSERPTRQTKSHRRWQDWHQQRGVGPVQPRINHKKMKALKASTTHMVDGDVWHVKTNQKKRPSKKTSSHTSPQRRANQFACLANDE